MSQTQISQKINPVNLKYLRNFYVKTKISEDFDLLVHLWRASNKKFAKS